MWFYYNNLLGNYQLILPLSLPQPITIIIIITLTLTLPLTLRSAPSPDITPGPYPIPNPYHNHYPTPNPNLILTLILQRTWVVIVLERGFIIKLTSEPEIYVHEMILWANECPQSSKPNKNSSCNACLFIMLFPNLQPL